MFTAALCSSCSQLLAAFRFLCLQLGYAAFRLRHWWVVAVSRPGSDTPESAVNRPSLLPTPQVTTLVTSVFLVVKVILSNVSDPHLTPPPLALWAALIPSRFPDLDPDLSFFRYSAASGRHGLRSREPPVPECIWLRVAHHLVRGGLAGDLVPGLQGAHAGSRR